MTVLISFVSVMPFTCSFLSLLTWVLHFFWCLVQSLWIKQDLIKEPVLRFANYEQEL